MLHRAVPDADASELGARSWGHVDAVLEAILDLTTSRYGTDFHSRLARGLTEALGCHTAFVGELHEVAGDSRVRTRAVWSRGALVEAVEYPLAGTPCEEVIRTGTLQVDRDVCARFPEDELLRDLHAESYLGVVLTGSDGEPVGHLAALDDRPILDDASSRTILQIFAARASVELDRSVVGSRLRNVEDNFRILFEQSPSAIILFDPDDWKPVEFNAQAAAMMGYTREEFAELTITDLEMVPNPEETRRHIARIRETGGDTFDALHKAKDGSPRHVVVSLRMTEWHGRPMMITLWHDITARMAAEQDKRLLEEQLFQNTTIVGESPAMAGVLSHVGKVAATDSTVLILGETGTGKELLARAIHEQSVRRDRVMVTVNCAALPKDLLESELFGHEKGAFTGATQLKRGRFELATGGTLFLDEVGELSAEAQAKLLRALQEGEIQRLGGEKTIRVNVRTVAATNRDLAEMVAEGQFRSDLYYRLSVFPLRVPPLRERRTDITPLVDHFVSACASRFGKSFTGFDEASMEKLLAYAWPGNIRELQNIIERSAILCSGPDLTLEGSLLQGPADDTDAGSDGLDEVTRRHMRRVLAECGWVVEGPRGAAVRLGLKPGTLRFRMKKLGIRRQG